MGPLPPSTLDLLSALFEGTPSAATARRWADEALALGHADDALVRLALLDDHEATARVTALLAPALEAVGVATRPPWRLAERYLRLLIAALLEGRASVPAFCARFEQAWVRTPGVADLPEQVRAPLAAVFDAAAHYTPVAADRAAHPALVGEEAVLRAARGAGSDPLAEKPASSL